MAKSERSEPRDRLSELPNSLIFHIFWFLPMDGFFRTSVLSSRWKTLWSTTPYLNFSFTNDTFEPQEFINRALLSWRGTRILKFKIEFTLSYPEWDEEESLRIDFDVWMRFAVEKEVEELYLPECMFDQSKREYKMPQCLHSCSSLKVLLLPACYIHTNSNRNLQWSQLKSLTMDGGCLSNCEHLINHVLCGSPQLEVLILTCWDSEKNLSIRSSSLRKLLIQNISFRMHPTKSTELRIWAPNLVTLEVSGDPYTKFLLMNVSSLTHANLDSFEDFLGIILLQKQRQILPTIQHFEIVELEHQGL